MVYVCDCHMDQLIFLLGNKHGKPFNKLNGIIFPFKCFHWGMITNMRKNLSYRHGIICSILRLMVRLDDWSHYLTACDMSVKRTSWTNIEMLIVNDYLFNFQFSYSLLRAETMNQCLLPTNIQSKRRKLWAAMRAVIIFPPTVMSTNIGLKDKWYQSNFSLYMLKKVKGETIKKLTLFVTSL